MTIYGENRFQFRPKASRFALLVAQLFAILSSAALAQLALSAADTFAAKFAGLERLFFVFAPFGGDYDSGALTTPPLTEAYFFSPLIVAGIALALGFVVSRLMPTAQSFGLRIFVHALAMTLAVRGCIAAALHLQTLEKAKAVTNVPGWAVAVVLAAIGAWLVMHEERAFIRMEQSFVSMDTPLERLVSWLQRIPLPFALLGALDFYYGYNAGAMACGIAIVVTLLDDLTHRPVRMRYEQLENPELREASIGMVIFFFVLAAGVTWTFGAQAIHRPYRVAAFVEGGDFQLMPADELRSTRYKYLTKRQSDRYPDPNREQKIDIRWSKGKKK